MPEKKLKAWIQALNDRLGRVIFLSTDWQKCLSNTLMGTRYGLDTAVFLDPPYQLKTGRKKNLYQSDIDGKSNETALEAYQWASANGKKCKVAYCMGEAGFPVPSGWSCEVRRYTSTNKARRDCIISSPACVGQKTLF